VLQKNFYVHSVWLERVLRLKEFVEGFRGCYKKTFMFTLFGWSEYYD
jgi:hypothetical protein